MRTSGLMRLRAEDTRALAATSTAVVARPMPRPLVAELVTAMVGHMPRIWANTMLFSQSPSLVMRTYSLLIFTLLKGRSWPRPWRAQYLRHRQAGGISPAEKARGRP